MNIPLTPQTNPRILAYIRALQFFQQNPFETSFCGLSKQGVLTLVQTYLEKNSPPGTSTPVNLLRFSDLLASKDISNEALNFSNQLTWAIQNLTAKINDPYDKKTDIDNPVSPKNLQVLAFENEAIRVTGNQSTPEKRSWWGANEGRRKIFNDNRWENQGNAEKLEKDLLSERNERIKTNLENQRKEEEREVWERIGNNLDKEVETNDKLKNIELSKEIIKAIDDTSHEDSFWTDASASLYKPIIRESFGQSTFQQREEQIQEICRQKIKQRLSQNPSLSSLAEDDDLIKKIVAAIPAKDLVRRSFLNFFDKELQTDTDDKSNLTKQERVGSLLFGKLSMAAEEATTGIKPGLKNRGKLLSDAILESFFELQSQGINVVNLSKSQINQLLFDKLGGKLNISPSSLNPVPDFDISLELQTNATLNIDEAIKTGKRSEDIHTIPIPGLLFFDKLAKTEIIANDAIFDQLKTMKVEEILGNQKNEELFHHLIFREEWEKNKKNPAYIPRPFNMEEKAVVKQYLESYQTVINKSAILGWLAHLGASANSMQKRYILGVPNAMAWQYTKAFLGMAIGNPTIVPLAFAYLAKNYIVWGKIGLAVKTKLYVGAVDKVSDGLKKIFGEVPIAKHLGFLKNFFYVEEHGMPIITWLHPKHAAKTITKDLGKKLARKTTEMTMKWTARFLGAQVAEKLSKTVLMKLLRAASGGIPVIGQILAIFGFLWDFIFPEWLKKIIKAIVAGVVIAIGWLIGLLIGVVGPLAAIGMVVGVLVSILFGAPFFAAVFVGGVIGFVLQGAAWLLSGGQAMWLMPTWAQPILSSIMQAGASLGQWIGGALKSIASGLPSVWGIAGVAQMAMVSVGSIIGVGAAGFVSVMMITTAVWTPIAPGAVPGGLVATDFMVGKIVQAIPLDSCEYKTVYLGDAPYSATTKCENNVTDPSKNITFEFIIQIHAQPGKIISSAQIEDKVTIIAQGPNITNPPTINTYTIIPPGLQQKVDEKLKEKPINGDTPDNTLEIKYIINLQDPKYQNSIVANLVKVTANGQSATNGATFTIGTPPPSDCPVKQGTINCASLGGSFTGCQHGSNSYWDSVGGKCSYNIPALTQTNGNSIAYPNATYCTNQSRLAADYGFALDIGPRDQVVFFPSVYGESLSWTLISDEQGNPNTPKKGDPPPIYGWGGIFSAKGKDFSYKMYMTHLEPNFHHSGLSGEVIGPMFANNPNGSHVHVELEKAPNNSTQWETLRPEFLCSY